jgi:hypothetical protein
MPRRPSTQKDSGAVTDSASSVGQARAAVMTAIRNASAATGVDFGYLVKTAQRESNFDPAAKASTSSATGLFQFTSETWLSMVKRYGASHGVAPDQSRDQLLELRKDPDLSARMAAELARENAGILGKKLGRPATQSELYAAHFMGPSETARLVEAARRNDGGPASALFPKAALANSNVFRSADGAQLTAAGLYQKLTGGDVATTDNQQVFAGAIEDTMRGDPSALLAARLGMTQLTSSLMAALFDFQSDDKKA